MRQPIWLRRPSGFKLTDPAGKRLLFYHDFALAPQQAVTKPVVGSAGSFSRGTTRPYFDWDGNYRVAAAGEIIYAKSPSGLLLPMLSPAATNHITNNSTYSPGLVETTLGNSVSWGGDGVTFTLKERVPSTTSGAHTTIRSISGVANGDVWCYAFIYKPLKGQTKARVRFRLGGGSTSPSSGLFDIGLDGSSTLPSEDTWFKPLKAGAVSIATGYYYCYASVYIKDKGDHTVLEAHHRVLDFSNNDSFTGDGTAYDVVGADGMYKNIIYPPAPIYTSGSTVTVAQDVLSFPFSTPFPSEGLTAHFEAELSVLSSELPPNDGRDMYFYYLGKEDYVAGETYSPFGAEVAINRGELRLDNGSSAPQPVSSSYWRESLQLTLSGDTYYRDGVQYTTRTQSRTAGMNPSPASIGINVSRYAPIWLRRYALVKGIVDPNLLLS